MDLYLVRHAWAEEPGDPRWSDDFQRPLTEVGKKRFAKVAKKLVERGMNPSVVATSPLIRCRQTADILALHLPGPPTVVEQESLAPGSDMSALVRWTRQNEAPIMAWVGHAPDMGEMCAALIGLGGGLIRFAKGSAALIRFPTAFIQPGAGELCWLTTAKILGE